MKILAVVPGLYDTSPGQRFRIEQWESYLRSKGAEMTYAPFETPELGAVLHSRGNSFAKVGSVIANLRRRKAGLADVTAFDLIYLFREATLLGPPWVERHLARSGKPIVFDFDDAIFVSYKSPSNGYLSYLKFPGKTAEICRLSTHVMAGNEYLADYARRTNPSVTIIPTTIDTEKYRVPDRSAGIDGPIRIGWSGSFSTLQHLDTLRPMLTELAKTEDFVLRVIGTSHYEIPGVTIESLDWRSESELEDLAPIDIGVMPLPDEDWTKGKCGLKALQYMSLGIPTICSPVGVNSTIVQDGENGFLADSYDEWATKLTMLMHSPDVRQRIGRAGRETVEKEYSAAVVAPKVLDVFETALKAKQPI